MPIIAQAIKKMRRDKKRNFENRKKRRILRDKLKETRQKATPKSLPGTYSMLDKAAKKGLIHKNKASRLKSRLSRLLA